MLESTKFSLVVQTWKGQIVIRGGPSRVLYRFFYSREVDKSHPISHFALDQNPIDVAETSAFWDPCPDEKAFERGTEMENRDYLLPKEGSFWNNTKNTPSLFARRLDKGEIIFYIDTEEFKKFLVKGKHLKGLFTLSRENTSDLWIWKKSLGPAEKKA